MIVTVAGRELDVRGVIVHDPHESVVDRSDCYDVVLDREWHGSNRHRLRARDLAGPVDPLDAARMLSDRLQKGPRHHPADVLAAMCRLCPANQDAVAAVPDKPHIQTRSSSPQYATSRGSGAGRGIPALRR